MSYEKTCSSLTSPPLQRFLVWLALLLSLRRFSFPPPTLSKLNSRKVGLGDKILLPSLRLDVCPFLLFSIFFFVTLNAGTPCYAAWCLMKLFSFRAGCLFSFHFTPPKFSLFFPHMGFQTPTTMSRQFPISFSSTALYRQISSSQDLRSAPTTTIVNLFLWQAGSLRGCDSPLNSPYSGWSCAHGFYPFPIDVGSRWLTLFLFAFSVQKNPFLLPRQAFFFLPAWPFCPQGKNQLQDEYALPLNLDVAKPKIST